MSDIIKGFGNLISSILEIFKGIIGAVIGTIQNVFNLLIDVVKNAFGAAEGIIGFLLGNIVLIMAIGCVFLAYLFYQQRQGKAVYVGNKKVN